MGFPCRSEKLYSMSASALAAAASSIVLNLPKNIRFSGVFIVARQVPRLGSNITPLTPLLFREVKRQFCEFVTRLTMRRFEKALLALLPSMWSTSSLGISPFSHRNAILCAKYLFPEKQSCIYPDVRVVPETAPFVAFDERVILFVNMPVSESYNIASLTSDCVSMLAPSISVTKRIAHGY